MDHFVWTDVTYLLDILIRIGFSIRIIMRRLPVGVSLAWLLVVLIFPFPGAVLYLLIGEYRLGPRRGRRAAEYRKTYRPAQAVAPLIEAEKLRPEATSLARVAETTLGAPVLAGNSLQLLPGADAVFPSLIADIDRTQRTCFLESYIWSSGGRADDVANALIRAAKRGVDCRVLVDALGSKHFLRGHWARELRQSGCRVVAALPSGLLRLLFVRPDLRLHKKIILFDGELAYTGSMNVADPHLFKRSAGVGEWVDAMVRVQGPAVDALAETYREDWYLEAGELLAAPAARQAATADSVSDGAMVQVLPTGPGPHIEAIEQVVLMMIYGARHEVVLTTPYFIPSESLLTALLSAAARGVQVTLITPARIDSVLVRYASRAFQRDLLAAGVCVALYKGGLLHTKSITVDGVSSMFGSLNLDPRSFRLDLEITLLIHDSTFTTALRALQESYLQNSEMLDLGTCLARSGVERFAENSARLVGPIL